MALQTTTDHAVITHLLDAAVRRDPVRYTLFGTIGLRLAGTAWAGWDGDGFAARSAAEWPVAISDGWNAATIPGLVTALADLDGLRGVSGPADVVDPVVERLDRPVVGREGQCLFRLDELILPAAVGAPLLAGEAHRPLVRDWFNAFGEEVDDARSDMTPVADAAVDGLLCWLWVDPDGTPVSVVGRRPVIGGSARIGPVYTPPALRGHGYASALTAAVAQTILDEAATPTLFTDLAYPTSNKIYQAIGFRPVEQRVLVHFG